MIILSHFLCRYHALDHFLCRYHARDNCRCHFVDLWRIVIMQMPINSFFWNISLYLKNNYAIWKKFIGCLRDPFARKIRILLLVHCHHSLYTCCYHVVSCCSQFSYQSQTGRSANARNFSPAYQASPVVCVVCMCTGVRRIRGVKMSHLVVNLQLSYWLTLLIYLSLLSQFRYHILVHFHSFSFFHWKILLSFSTEGSL